MPIEPPMISDAVPDGPSIVSVQADCPLCVAAGEDLLWANDSLRVILVADPAYPGYTRVIWRWHVTEMTDLPPASSASLMSAVWAVESVQRAVLAPDKVNLASLGNRVAHMHWHVIPRWVDDACFPDSIWSPPQRAAHACAGAMRARERLADYAETLRNALDAISSGE